MKQKEIERKFLINLPNSWEDLALLFDNLLTIKRIEQTYLNKEEGDQQSGRVRKTIDGFYDNTKTYYHYNIKKFIEKSVNEEQEKEISGKEYEKLLKNKDLKLITLEKTRYVFTYNDQTFELDIFKGPLKGLAILEIELENKDDTVEMPPYLNIIEEVTGDKRFNNYSLAEKTLINKL